MIVGFTDTAFEEYNYWCENNKKIHKRIKELINDIKRSPFEGIGKPEPLKHELSGCWSRRITDEDRLVYEVREEMILIYSCRTHYHK